MGFFGTDGAEKSGSVTLQNKPQLDGSRSLESQAKFISSFGAVDDLTFNERTVRDVSDRGRAKVVDELVSCLSLALQKGRELRRTAQAVAVAGPPCKMQQEVRTQLDILRRVRASGKPADAPTARLPLQKLDLLAVDGLMLKRTKVALELNQDYWKSTSAPEVRRLATGLVKKWRSIYHREEEGPSARTLRNSATDLEDNAHGFAPQTVPYTELIEALLRRLQKPELAAGVVDGREQAPDLVGRIHKRQVAEKKNAGNPVPVPLQWASKRPIQDEEKPHAEPPLKRLSAVPALPASDPSAAIRAFVASGGGLPAQLQTSATADSTPAVRSATTFASRLSSSSSTIILPI